MGIVLTFLGIFAGVVAFFAAANARVRNPHGAEAAPRRIRFMVMRELIWILGFGLGPGIPAALAALKLVESRLFGVQARDVGIVGRSGSGDDSDGRGGHVLARAPGFASGLARRASIRMAR